jgi:hypothetical protein
MVVHEVRGEKLSTFVATNVLKCNYCNETLRMPAVIPLLTPDALSAYQNALCTVASIESEKITELRLKHQYSSSSTTSVPLDPHAAIIAHIQDIILPFCKVCNRKLLAFDGCSALQCGVVGGGIVNKDVGCGAHICALCQNIFVDGHACHQHVLECMYNQSGMVSWFRGRYVILLIIFAGDMYPPLPHPQSWYSIHRQVGLNRVWVYVTSQGCDDAIWIQIQRQWPELFENHTGDYAYLAMCKQLLAAADEYSDRTDLFTNMDKYVLAYQDVSMIGFDVAISIVCRLICINRGNTQAVVTTLMNMAL